MQESLDKLIDLAQKVGGDAWPILVKNQMYMAITSIIEAILWGIGCGILFITINKLPKPRDQFDESLSKGLIAIGKAIAILITFSVISFDLTTAFYKAINPQGAALCTLIECK